MSDPPKQPSIEQGRRSLVFLAIFVGSLGSCGACGAASQLSDTNYVAPDPKVSAAVSDMQQQIDHLLFSHPHRRALVVGTILVHLMLLVGGYLLIARRPNASWWVRNSLVANIVWTGVQCVSNYMHTRDISSEVRRIIAGGPGPPDEAAVLGPSEMGTRILLYGVIHAAVLSYLLWRINSAEVQAAAKSTD